MVIASQGFQGGLLIKSMTETPEKEQPRLIDISDIWQFPGFHFQAAAVYARRLRSLAQQSQLVNWIDLDSLELDYGTVLNGNIFFSKRSEICNFPTCDDGPSWLPLSRSTVLGFWVCHSGGPIPQWLDSCRGANPMREHNLLRLIPKMISRTGHHVSAVLRTHGLMSQFHLLHYFIYIYMYIYISHYVYIYIYRFIHYIMCTFD